MNYFDVFLEVISDLVMTMIAARTTKAHRDLITPDIDAEVWVVWEEYRCPRLVEPLIMLVQRFVNDLVALLALSVHTGTRLR